MRTDVRKYGHGGLKQCVHFTDVGGGSIFLAILCECLLWTDPSDNYHTLQEHLTKSRIN